MLIAGCPANGRDWVIKHWVSHLRRAADHADTIVYVLSTVPEYDEATSRALQEACMTHDVELYLHRSDEPPREDRRDWSVVGRYQHIAEIRNSMLATVRLLEPDFFLSIDSDILIGKKVLTNLLESVRDYDAVGGKVWLSPRRDDPNDGIHTVNYAKFNGQMNILRRNADGVFRVDVLMALKLMKPDAYWIDYAPNSQGEDIGWSLNARDTGLVLGWDGRIASKHIMHHDDLHMVDERVGW